MRAGMLRHKVRIERRTVAATNEGGYSESWEVLARPSASILPIRGREFLESNAMGSDVTHRIQLRHSRQYTLTPRDRIVGRDGRVFAIVSAYTLGERDRTVEVMAKEAV